MRKAAQAALALVNDTLLERTVDTKRLSAVGRDLEDALDAEHAQPVAWKELLREARDNCKASIAEDGISAMRREYRVELEARLTAALAAAPPAPAAPARLTDADFLEARAATYDVVGMGDPSWFLHYGRAVEAEVLRRMGVAA